MPARRSLRRAQHHVLNGDAVEGGQGLLLDHRHVPPLAPAAQHHAQAEAALGPNHHRVVAIRQLQEEAVRLHQNGLQIVGLRLGAFLDRHRMAVRHGAGQQGGRRPGRQPVALNPPGLRRHQTAPRMGRPLA